jgi:hypothetical protein
MVMVMVMIIVIVIAIVMVMVMVMANFMIMGTLDEWMTSSPLVPSSLSLSSS